jgi:hypothetical protein
LAQFVLGGNINSNYWEVIMYPKLAKAVGEQIVKHSSTKAKTAGLTVGLSIADGVCQATTGNPLNHYVAKPFHALQNGVRSLLGTTQENPDPLNIEANKLMNTCAVAFTTGLVITTTGIVANEFCKYATGKNLKETSRQCCETLGDSTKQAVQKLSMPQPEEVGLYMEM